MALALLGKMQGWSLQASVATHAAGIGVFEATSYWSVTNLLWIPREFWSPELPVPPPELPYPPPELPYPTKKISDEKNMFSKKILTKKIRTKKFRRKNFGRKLGARHGGKARPLRRQGTGN